jgi:tetratricopeptide (TPR) repeat protein
MQGSLYYSCLKTLLIISTVLSISFGQAKAEPVKVRAATHDGYGRIVFNWPTPVPFKIKTVGAQLVVSFSSPIEPYLSGVVQKLSKYLSSAVAGADGRSVAFTMKEDFDVYGFDMGANIVIDITDAVQAKKVSNSEKKGDIKEPAEAAAQVLTSGPTVKVRSGIHDDYTRIVFDWPNKVPYQLKQRTGQATIVFSSSARLDIGSLKRRLPKLITSINSESTANGVLAKMAIPDTSRIRHFLSGPKVVVDIMKPIAEPSSFKNDKAVAEGAQKKERKPDVKPDPKPAKKVAPKPPEAPVRKPVEQASSSVVPSLSSQTGKPRALNPPSRSRKSDLAKSEQRSQSMVAKVKVDENSGDVKGGSPANLSNVDGGVDTIGIRFDWDEPVAAAIFRRYGYLWIVFDKKIDMNLANLKSAAGNIFRSIEQVPNDKATLLRVMTVSGVNPTIKRDGLAWVLDFRQQPIVPAMTIEVTPQPNSPVGARLFLAVTEPGEVIRLTDPEIGDSLVVVPIIPLGHGIDKQHNYPQVHILPSSQGLVMKPRADDLLVRTLRQGVSMTSVSGLKISNVPEAQLVSNIPGVQSNEQEEDKIPAFRALSRLFDLKKWQKTNLITFEEEKQKYQLAAATASSGDKEAARMDLARFYFSNGFGAEALGVLKVVAEERPQIEDSLEFYGLRGAINVLMGRYDDAREELEHKSLNGNDEARFWRAALQAYEGDLFGAAPNLRRAAVVIRPYPPVLNIQLGTLVAEAAVELGDIRRAKQYLKRTIDVGPNPEEMSQLQYVEGRVLELSGDFDGAVSKWEEVQNGPHRPSRAKAAVARTELLLEQELIDDFGAIQELEKLRFAWRGDRFEFDLLRRLGDLYIAVGDYRNGLRTMRQAATHFRNYKDAAEVTQKMIDFFAGLYLEDKANSMSPITAIALYDEFKELTPPGKKGAEMVRRLADRLVGVDLLDRAAELLQDQVEFRLDGVEKARVGAQLALIHILAHNFEDSTRILDGSSVQDISKELADQRRHLRSRSLMGQERIEEALALLKQDKSMDADLLRMEMYWNDHNWVQVSQTLNRILRTYEAKANQPLDELQAQTVLNMGIAMTLSGNERGIERLRLDYGEAMDESPFRDAFRLIASPDTFGLISYTSIAGKVKDVKNFQTFMSAYQERLRVRKLSEIN